MISVSKGLERGTGKMMSEVIAATLGNRQPCAFLSGPSFAKEVMDLRPTGVVAASKAGPRHDIMRDANCKLRVPPLGTAQPIVAESECCTPKRLFEMLDCSAGSAMLYALAAADHLMISVSCHCCTHPLLNMAVIGSCLDVPRRTRDWPRQCRACSPAPRCV